jgi:protein-tyrosine phosphatase
MIDLHCHIIPGVDDGPKDSEEALSLCRMLQKEGVEVIVATPHYYPEEWLSARITEVAAGCHDLRNLLGDDGPIIISGGEVAVYNGIAEAVFEGRVPLLGEGKSVLLETPFWQMPLCFEEEIFKLLAKGYRPILAHPERSREFRRIVGDLLAIRRQGMMLQVTAGSLTGSYGTHIKAAARTLAAQGGIDLVASDLHPGRKPDLKAAYSILSRLIGTEAADRVFYDNPVEVLGKIGKRCYPCNC